MMHGCGKSSPVIVAVRPANKAELSTAAESVERRAGAKGNATSKARTGDRTGICVAQALVRMPRAAVTARGLDPRREPYAGKPRVRVCAGGAQ